ncbi:hypothetical protein [Zoogloea sp.]|uniref:hypothetical protein n=1 Tax=Zoogloea sp. TaxID=49181 RepID=UPI0014156D43|nr:MAG: hypothetical protein F9K15_00720 [Zoogloea sp.]
MVTLSSPAQSRLPDPGAALAAYRDGAVTVLASDPLRPGSACLLAALETLRPETLSQLRSLTRGLISVLLPDRQRYGVRLFLSCEGQAADLSSHSGAEPGVGSNAALCPLLHGLVCNPCEAERQAAAFGDPFVTLSGAGTLSWPDSERVVSTLAVRFALADAALICSLHDSRGRCLHGDEVSEFAAAHGLPLLYPDDVLRGVRLHAAG